ncbi:MAG: hypothetical protein IT159_05430 [Bryobacterales bacterium]|nr:hypothetical protein [Bryobacterales bacterium]
MFCHHARFSQSPSHDCCQPARPDHCSKPDPRQECPGHGTDLEFSARAEAAGVPAAFCTTAAAAAPSPEAPLPAAAPIPFTENAQPPPPERFLLTTVLLI